MHKKHEATLQANMMLSRDEDDLVQYDKEWVEAQATLKAIYQ
jgi:hypothetical protein